MGDGEKLGLAVSARDEPPVARRRGIFTHRKSSKKRRLSASVRRLGIAENYARLRQAQSSVQRAARLLVTLVVGDCLMHRRHLSGVSSAGLA